MFNQAFPEASKKNWFLLQNDKHFRWHEIFTGQKVAMPFFKDHNLFRSSLDLELQDQILEVFIFLQSEWVCFSHTI